MFDLKQCNSKRFFMFWMILFVWHLNARAEPVIRFLPNKQNVNTIVLENDVVEYTFILDKAVKISSILHKGIGQEIMTDNTAINTVNVRSPNAYQDVGYQLFSLEQGKDKDRVTFTVTQRSSYVDNPFVVKQTWSLGKELELTWKVTVVNTAVGGRSHRVPRSLDCHVTFPVIQNIFIDESDKCRYFLPTQARFYKIWPSSDALFYFTWDNGCGRMLDIWGPLKNAGLYFHIQNSVFDFDFEGISDLKSKVFRLSMEPGQEKMILYCRMCPHAGDWYEALKIFKTSIRSGFDFTYYTRPVQDKFLKLWILHFTFLYGHDIYDPVSNEFIIRSFLEKGKADFGGYDGLLLWHDYPRLGIDERDQFDMYEDLPGGIEGLRNIVEQAHNDNVQVYIPYKPWDIMKGRKDHFRQVARMAKALDADGIFLDTMQESDKAFREIVDRVNNSIVFLSEGRPYIVSAYLLNGSWNEKKTASNRMPVVDLFRFILPEHKVFNVRRADRRRVDLIYNALFNGIGIILWEDVFGEINRFSWDERILINRYSRIVRENSDAFNTREPVPLFPTYCEDLYVNAFPTLHKCVYVCYQHKRDIYERKIDSRLMGPVMEADHPDEWHFVDVWNHKNVFVEKKDSKIRLVFTEEPSDVISCIVGMPRLLDVNVRNDSLYVKTKEKFNNIAMRINIIDNLTLIEKEKITLTGTNNSILISDLDLKYSDTIIIKLMQDDILRDEVILDSR